jgi:peptidoglycan hydrolase-like protein with peptidoglycan-binding domain
LSERGSVGTINRFFINNLMTDPPVLRCPKLVPAIKTLDRDLRFGERDTDVQALQAFLNTNQFLLATDDFGAVSRETTYFGPRTRASLTRFQITFNLLAEKGRLGPATRAFINALLANTAAIGFTTTP